MNIMTVAPPAPWTLADLAERFGADMPLSRIRFDPAPGTATEQDVLDLNDHHDRLCELVDGVLLEKTVGYRESILAIALARFLGEFIYAHRLGVLAGADGLMRLAPRLVRIPDLSFVAWDRFPGRRIPRDPVPDLAPDLAVEVLSPSNTRTEMARKRQDYFQAGCRLVWEIDPDTRTVALYTSPDESTVLTVEQTLEGGAVLPGFNLPLRQLFAILDEQGPTVG